MPLPRLAVAFVAAALVLSGPLTGGAWATEIAPPAPLTSDIGAIEGRTTLARWLGMPEPEDAVQLITTSSPASATPGGESMIVGVGDEPALRLPVPAAAHLPPLPLVLPASGARADHGPGLVLGSAAEPLLDGTIATGGGAPHGDTRFDVRASDRNPIALGGDVLDEITARVVRTPEPGTLALFALGAAALGIAAARRRRRR